MMRYRFLAAPGLLAAMLAFPAAGQSQHAVKAKTSGIPRTPDGHPDLQGVWTNATVTPMQRPPAYGAKASLTDAEAREFEQKQASDLQSVDGKSEHPLLAAAGSNGTGGYNVLFIDRGSELARVDGVKRTSLIIDPPDGKMPPITSEARQRNASVMRSYFTFNTVKDRPLSERCLIGFGSTSGPPMMPVLYNNNYQIVQTPDSVMISVEMVHDVRIIRINGTHKPPSVRQWLGDSIGHWEGDTLVVDTTNFTDQTKFEGGVAESACHRALPAHRPGYHSLSRYNRRSIDLHQDLDDGISVPRHAGPGVRVRVPRRQLRDARHYGRRAETGSRFQEQVDI